MGTTNAFCFGALTGAALVTVFWVGLTFWLRLASDNDEKPWAAAPGQLGDPPCGGSHVIPPPPPPSPDLWEL
jgi:hypothetical protein